MTTRGIDSAALREALLERVERQIHDAVHVLDDAELLAAVGAEGPVETVARVLSAAPHVGLERGGGWARALLRGAAQKQAMLRDAGGVLTSGEAAELLGISRPAVKQRMRRGTLLAVPLANGDWGFPAAQFDARGRVHTGLPAVLAALRGVDPWVAFSLLVAPASGGEGTVLESLDDPAATEAAVELARTFGGQGAA